MRGRTIVAAGITAALLGGGGVAYSDLRDDGSHVHVTNSPDSPVPVRDENLAPVNVMFMDMGAAAGTGVCRVVSKSTDGAKVLTSLSLWAQSNSRPAAWLRFWTYSRGLNIAAVPLTQIGPTSWGGTWNGEISVGLGAEYTTNDYADPADSAPGPTLVQVDVCVKNYTDPIGTASGTAVLHRVQ